MPFLPSRPVDCYAPSHVSGPFVIMSTLYTSAARQSNPQASGRLSGRDKLPPMLSSCCSAEARLESRDPANDPDDHKRGWVCQLCRRLCEVYADFNVGADPITGHGPDWQLTGELDD